MLVAREGRLPAGAGETVSEAGGNALVVGSDAEEAAGSLTDATTARWCDTGPAFRPGELARALATAVATVPLVLLPASPDGRDLAPRLAAWLDRPLLARALSATCIAGEESGGTTVRALVARLDDRVLVPVEVHGPAVVTLVSGGRTRRVRRRRPDPRPARRAGRSGPGDPDRRRRSTSGAGRRARARGDPRTGPAHDGPSGRDPGAGRRGRPGPA